jgi:hypothetical protein
MEIDDLPAFEDMGTEWFLPFSKFLNDNGYEYHGCGTPRSHGLDRLKTEKGVDGYVVVGGKSPRPHVTRGHAVVFKDGEMVHDPHESNEGILEIHHWYMIERKENNE